MAGTREYRIRSADEERRRAQARARAEQARLATRLPTPGRQTALEGARWTPVDPSAIGKHTLEPRVDARDHAALVASYVAQAHAALARLADANEAKDARTSAASASELARLLGEAERSIAKARETGEDVEVAAVITDELARDAAAERAVAFQPSVHAAVHVAGFRNHAFEHEASAWAKSPDQSPSERAERATSGPGEALPFRDRIQASFGGHDISRVRAHVGGGAGQLARQLGARAFARGDSIAFADGAVDLFTAAHEAAHVVQQRAGIALKGELDEPGDAFEQHADAVAMAVVRGVRAEPLLDRMAGLGASAPARTAFVQRKTGAASSGDEHADMPKLVSHPGAKWPVFAQNKLPYLIVASDRFWTVSEWIKHGDGFQQKGAIAASPTCAAEILRALGWVKPDRIASAARDLAFSTEQVAMLHTLAASAIYFDTGAPTRSPTVSRIGHERVEVAVPLENHDVADGTAIEIDDAQRTLVIRALADATKLVPLTNAVAELRRDNFLRTLVARNGTVLWSIGDETGNEIFGYDDKSDSDTDGRFTQWLRRDGKNSVTGPKEPLVNYYAKSIPGEVRVDRETVEAGHPVWLDVAVKWPARYPSAAHYDVVPMVTRGHLETNEVSLLSCDWYIERVDGFGATPVASGNLSTMSLITGGLMPSKGTPEHTDVGELAHTFELAPGEETGTFRVRVHASFDEYFEPTQFTKTVQVKSTSLRMRELRDDAFADFAAVPLARTPEDFDATGSGDDNHGVRTIGVLPPGAATTADPHAASRVAERHRLEAIKMYLQVNRGSEAAIDAVDRQLAAMKVTDDAVAADVKRGWQPFQIRGTYLSRTAGVPDGPLSLYGSVHAEPVAKLGAFAEIVVQIRDLSRRFGNEDLTFTGHGQTFDVALKAAFTDEAKAYPTGVLAIEAETITTSANQVTAQVGKPDGTTIGFELGTDSRAKRLMAKLSSPTTSVIANLGAAAIMAFVPGSAAVVMPMLIAYNAAQTVDRARQEAAQGTLTLGSAARSAGELALDVLPVLGRAKPFTGPWLAVETANWGGQALLMTDSAIDDARKLQAGDVEALATMYEELQQLEAANADPAVIEAKRKAITDRATAVSKRIVEQFDSQIQTNAMFGIASSLIHHAASASARAGIIDTFAKKRGAPAPDEHLTERDEQQAAAQMQTHAADPKWQGVEPGKMPSTEMTAEQRAIFVRANAMYEIEDKDNFRKEQAARIQWQTYLGDHGVYVEDHSAAKAAGESELGEHQPAARAIAPSDKRIAHDGSLTKRSANTDLVTIKQTRAALDELTHGSLLEGIRRDGDRLIVPTSDGKTRTITVAAPSRTEAGQMAALKHGEHGDTVWVSDTLHDDQVTRALGAIVGEALTNAGRTTNGAKFGELDAMFVHRDTVAATPKPQTDDLVARAKILGRAESVARIDAEIDLAIRRLGVVEPGSNRNGQLAAMPASLAARIRARLEHPIVFRADAAIGDAAVARPTAEVGTRSSVLPDAPAQVHAYGEADLVRVMELRVEIERIKELDARVAQRDQPGTNQMGTGNVIAPGEAHQRVLHVNRARALMAELQLGGDTTYVRARLAEMAKVFPGIERDLVPAIEERLVHRDTAAAEARGAEQFRKDRTRQLDPKLDGSIMNRVINSGEFFKTNRLVIGDGFTALARIASLGVGKSGEFVDPAELLVVAGGSDTIARIADKNPSFEWGQRAGVYDRANGAHPAFADGDGHGTGALTDAIEDRGAFMPVDQLRNGMDRARQRLGIGALPAHVLAVETIKEVSPGSPTWHDPQSTVRVLVDIDVGGTKKRMYIYSNDTDITSGPGAPRMPNEAVLDKHDREALTGSGAMVSGEKVLEGKPVKGLRVLVLGFGPTGAWTAKEAVRGGAGRVDYANLAGGDVGGTATGPANDTELAKQTSIDRVQDVLDDSAIHITIDRILRIEPDGVGATVTYVRGSGKNIQRYKIKYDVVATSMGYSAASDGVGPSGDATIKSMIGGMKMVPQPGTKAPVIQDAATGHVHALGFAASDAPNVTSEVDVKTLSTRHSHMLKNISADSPDSRVVEGVGDTASTVKADEHE